MSRWKRIEILVLASTIFCCFAAGAGESNLYEIVGASAKEMRIAYITRGCSEGHGCGEAVNVIDLNTLKTVVVATASIHATEISTVTSRALSAASQTLSSMGIVSSKAAGLTELQRWTFPSDPASNWAYQLRVSTSLPYVYKDLEFHLEHDVVPWTATKPGGIGYSLWLCDPARRRRTLWKKVPPDRMSTSHFSLEALYELGGRPIVVLIENINAHADAKYKIFEFILGSWGPPSGSDVFIWEPWSPSWVVRVDMGLGNRDEANRLFEGLTVGDPEVFKGISKEVNDELRRQLGYSAMAFAWRAPRRNWQELVKILLVNGVPIDEPDYPGGKTSLMVAAEYGDEEFCAFLIKGGADVTRRTDYDRTVLDFAGDARQPGFVSRFIDLCKTLNPTGSLPTPSANKMVSSIFGGSIKEMEEMIALGADVNARDAEGDTPLIWAVNTVRVHPGRNDSDRGDVLNKSTNSPIRGKRGRKDGRRHGQPKNKNP